MAALLDALATVQGLTAFAGLVALLAWESARPFFDFFHRSWRVRGRHLLRNVVLGGLNAVVVVGVFVGLWLIAAVWAEEQQIGLLNGMQGGLGTPVWLHTVGAIVLMDAWSYVWHRLNHRIPLLWRFHRVHHADTQMDVTTASRFHLGEIILSSLLRVPLILLLGLYAWEILLYETIMFAVVQMHHANIGFPEHLDRVFRWVIVTPAMHKVHHSRWRPETDSNYSALFSIWDRLGASFRLRERLEDIRFGVEGFEEEAHATVKGLLRMPFMPPTLPDPEGEVKYPSNNE